MENIYNILDEIQNTLKANKLHKSNFHHFLTPLNNLIKEKVGEIKLDNSKFDNLLIKSNKERIEELDKKLSNLGNSTNLLPEAVLLGRDKIHLFLKKYNIGFLRNLELTDMGTFKVEIGALITNHSAFHNKDVSKKIKFEYQMSELLKLGLDIDKSTLGNNKVILGTQNSIDKINTLIENIGGHGIEVSIRNYKGQKSIKSILFRIKPEELYKFNDSSYEMSYNVNDILNDDEIPELIYNIKELKSSLNNFSCDELKEVHICCKNIALHSFAKMCEILDFRTEISDEVEKTYEKSKKEMTIIREKEELVKEKIDPSKIKSAMENIMKILELFASEEICFIPTNVNVTSELNVDFIFNKCGMANYIYNDNINEITEEKLKSTFDCSDGNFDNENLLIFNTKENIDKLNNILINHFKNAKITSIDVSNKNFIGYYINKITVSFPDLTMF